MIPLIPTDAEVEVAKLTAEEQHTMAELVLQGWRFVPTTNTRFFVFTPEGEPPHAFQINGDPLRRQLERAVHYHQSRLLREYH